MRCYTSTTLSSDATPSYTRCSPNRPPLGTCRRSHRRSPRLPSCRGYRGQGEGARPAGIAMTRPPSYRGPHAAGRAREGRRWVSLRPSHIRRKHRLPPRQPQGPKQAPQYRVQGTDHGPKEAHDARQRWRHRREGQQGQGTYAHRAHHRRQDSVLPPRASMVAVSCSPQTAHHRGTGRQARLLDGPGYRVQARLPDGLGVADWLRWHQGW